MPPPKTCGGGINVQRFWVVRPSVNTYFT